MARCKICDVSDDGIPSLYNAEGRRGYGKVDPSTGVCDECQTLSYEGEDTPTPKERDD